MKNRNRHFEVLLTAQEAYPALEKQFLDAQNEIIAGFRIFDARTKLRLPAAQEIGETWIDLICHTLKRGVRITLTISDFDPIARASLHQYAWDCYWVLLNAAEKDGCRDNLTLRIATHPARVGILPRILLWPRLISEISKCINDIDNVEHTPNLKPLVKRKGAKLSPRLFPIPPLAPVSHHQKLAVFDGQRLFIGGLDLNERRYDTPAHNQESDETWHDVQVLTDGPVAVEARQHLLEMDDVFEGKATKPKTHLLRTISAKRRVSFPYMSPRRMVTEIADTHAAQIALSENLIYFETQFFRDETLARHLAKRAQENPDLSLIIILPAAPEDVAFSSDWGVDAAYGEHLQVKCIDIVRQAFGDRAFFGSPAQRKLSADDGRAVHFDAPIVYLHAKVSIFDDRMGIVSSANLNGRSMNWDTEAGIKTAHPQEVLQLKTKCFTHWLGADASEAFFNRQTARKAWSDLATSNTQRAPDQRRGFILPYLSAPAEKIAQALPGVPAEMA
ncbi:MULTISPECIES: phospholipase D-like domain-containing protein [Rhodobacterales]|uniref:phospholipase D-like domain-containing protein n=1 Tax=Rhodobacterales TaxID=204455 RepID=UPI0015F0E0AD|nr:MULTISPECIES: phospholipase D family protein [Rhodobacterales]MDO6590339.1 phospholipase D family protein [Yoonia sp. 1_MG-2023]